MFFDNEAEIEAQNEQDQEDLQSEMALYGYVENNTDFFDTKSYEKLILDFIKNKQRYISNFNLPPRTINFLREAANKIIIDQTGSLNRKVLYLEEDQRLIYDFTAEHGEITQENYDEVIKYIKKKAKKREVTTLPIRWFTSTSRNGISRIYHEYPEDIEFIKKFPMISTGISMINQNDDLGITVLVHEMTHALIDRHKGIIKNILHDEVLSIYLELVAAYELEETGKLLDITTKFRLLNLKNNILTSQQQIFNGVMPDGENYIDSCLYAFNLFEIYKNSSSNARKSIREEINKTLSGRRQLEDTLQVLDVTEEEGNEIIRKQIKTILR